MTKPPNKYSAEITQPRAQGASQAMLYATGLREQDMAKPQVGIASMWFEGDPCNMHRLQPGEKVMEGVTAAGMVGLRFNTMGVSDGISMGTEGMSFSLQSRGLIADSIEAPWNIGEFYGSSYFCDPRGQIFAQASRDKDEVLTADLDLDKIADARKTWQFYRDRRPEMYGDLVKP